MKHPLILLAFVAAAELSCQSAARAADPRYPDWPCNQLKVPELSAASMWTGPSIEGVGDAWRRDPTLSDLVPRIAARRTSLDEARKAIANYLTGSEAERRSKAKLLFAGLFANLNRERSQVMDGIERYARKQKEFADKIRADAEKARAEPPAENDQSKPDSLASTISWEMRVYDERRQTIRYVCEVPVRIEQRLFALARSIQQAID